MIGKPVGKRRAKERAEQLLHEYFEGGGTVPVRIAQLVESHGIEVVREAAGPDLAGMLVVDDDVSVIVVNADDAPYRQMFTLAHELGHYLLHRPTGAAAFHRDERSRTGTDRVEIDANTFAAEVLMPEAAVRMHAGDLSVDLATDHGLEQIAKLARRFDVSTQAMSFRLQNLGILKLDGYW